MLLLLGIMSVATVVLVHWLHSDSGGRGRLESRWKKLNFQRKGIRFQKFLPLEQCTLDRLVPDHQSSRC